MTKTKGKAAPKELMDYLFQNYEFNSALDVQEALQDILEEFQYKEKARKCTINVILSYLIHSAANEWKSIHHAADVGRSLGLTAVDHSSLSKHLKGLDYAIVKRVMEVMIGKLNRAARRKSKLPKALL